MATNIIIANIACFQGSGGNGIYIGITFLISLSNFNISVCLNI